MGLVLPATADGRRDCAVASCCRRGGIIRPAGLGVATERPDSDRAAPLFPPSECASEARLANNIDPWTDALPAWVPLAKLLDTVERQLGVAPLVSRDVLRLSLETMRIR